MFVFPELDAPSPSDPTVTLCVQLREEIAAAKRNLEDMDTVTEEDSSEMAKYDLLVKRDQDMTAFIEAFPATRAGILAEQQRAQDTIVLLLEDVSKGLEDSANMPSQEAHADMVEAKVRKGRYDGEGALGLVF